MGRNRREEEEGRQETSGSWRTTAHRNQQIGVVSVLHGGCASTPQGLKVFLPSSVVTPRLQFHFIGTSLHKLFAHCGANIRKG